MTVNMVESVPTKWGERERERGEKGGCRECLDFREIEECYLNITANTYIFVRRKRPLEINWIFTWQYEPLSVFVWYSNPKIQPNIKITKNRFVWDKFKTNNNNPSMTIPLTWKQDLIYDSTNNFFFLSGVTCLWLREEGSSLLIKLAACDEYDPNFAAFQ